MPISVKEEVNALSSHVLGHSPHFVDCTDYFRDPTLPPYYEIHNCALIFCALDTWGEANFWRIRARDNLPHEFRVRDTYE